MKKIISGVLSLIFIISCVVPASAAVLKPAIKLETGRVIDGEFPVYVYLIDCKGLSACDMVIGFNTKALEFKYCNEGKDALEVSNTMNNRFLYEINQSSKAGMRISFLFNQSLLTAEEFAQDAKNGLTVNVNDAKFQAFELWFSVPENAAETAEMYANAKISIKGIEDIYLAQLSFKPSKLPVYVPVRGDVNLDEEVTAEDARITLRCAVKLEILTRRPLKNADMDADGEITAGDARRILRIAVKLPEEG